MTNSGAFRKGEKRPNQGKHGPPKATLAAREAIAAFVDANAHKLQEWLDAMAADSPKDAFNAFLALVEYHVPKLARTELTGPNGGPIVVSLDDADRRA